MKSSTSRFAAGLALAVGVMGTGLATSTAAMAHPPLDCVQDVADPGCHGDGGEGGGSQPGRTFLTAADVDFMDYYVVDVKYDAAQWDSRSDFNQAVEDYWDVHSSASSVCLFSSGHCGFTATPLGRTGMRFEIFPK